MASISSTPASGWPAKVAYFCATILAAAAIGTNAVYGFGRGDNLAQSLIWSGVAIAVSAACTLAWPATMRALSNRDWPAAAMCAAAGALFLAFSLAGALGAASSGRTTAASIETGALDARKRAQSSYDAAQAELAKLEPSRPVAELLPLVDAAKPQCRVRVDSNGRQTVCSKPSALLAELGRAHRRSELQTQIERASAALSDAKPGRPANADSAAVAKYLRAIGIDVTPERVTDLLVLLAVLALELGPGACMCLALTLSAPPAARTEAPDGRADTDRTPANAACTPPADAPDATVRPASVQVSVERPTSVRPSSVAAWLQAHGGRAQTSMRRLALEIGRSPSGVHDEIGRLVASGAITVASGPRGTTLAMRPN